MDDNQVCAWSTVNTGRVPAGGLRGQRRHSQAAAEQSLTTRLGRGRGWRRQQHVPAVVCGNACLVTPCLFSVARPRGELGESGEAETRVEQW